jgi:hypothetical protein
MELGLPKSSCIGLTENVVRSFSTSFGFVLHGPWCSRKVDAVPERLRAAYEI